MHMHTHLVVSISGHGFGHVAQTAPILNALHERYPTLRITVRSSVAQQQLQSRIHVPFNHLQSTGDIGMVMTSPLDVDIGKSRAAYHAFHAGWQMRVAEEARLLKTLGADFVLSNVGYLPLAGARQAGIPAVALCSLNWADIYRHYCCTTGTKQDEKIAAQILDCYANADAFLRATPGMAMKDLQNLIPVAPIAAVGTNRRDELNRHLKLSSDEKLLLVSMGGIASRLPIENWPSIKGVRYLIPASWQACPESNLRVHPDAIVIESLPFSFGELLASVDALVCKPGYGSFVEAACSSVPVLYVGRPGWPESIALIAWLEQHGVSREIAHDALQRGDITCELEKIWSTNMPEPVIPTGVNQVAAWLAERLG